MKRIPVTKGKFAIVDDEDYPELNQFKWHLDSKGYAIRWSPRNHYKRHYIYMHREIMKTPADLYTDHINFNRLDNRRENLRICTKRQNQIHQSNSRNTTGLRGISWNKRDELWVVQISSGLGILKRKSVKDKKVAIELYNQWSEEYHGEFGVKHNV